MFIEVTTEKVLAVPSKAPCEDRGNGAGSSGGLKLVAEEWSQQLSDRNL